ncbi:MULTISPECIES: germination protein YpeB [Paenibacillus]|uniref:Germination protein YpeB n=1 Tax=Paenibacillus violae TaxID=3077234 RepID=A0ABU3R797_9BACL|nr:MULTISPECIES: germination protein YpeB [Paenibacillus]MDU0199936.1 germination protein YpeB [Paenibacillus sp. PFR10]MEC0271287.1 germination protein YpeB [Paenibacillus anseongense]
MYKRLSIVMFPFLLVALIGASVWGYLEHQEKNTILIKAENQYQRAFHDLSFHMDKLHTELGNTLAVNSTAEPSYRKGLVNVWRLTSQAQSDITQLPLTLLPFNKTEDFLANMANYSYRMSVRDMTKQPLTETEIKTLSSLYDHSAEITKEIRGVQDKVMTNNLRWMDVEMALASENEVHDNAIIDGFSIVDKKVGAYEELNWGPGSMGMLSQKKISMLSGNEMTADQIKQKAAQFLGQADTANMQVVENGGNSPENQSFSVVVPSGTGGADSAQMDYTKKGGHLIYFMKPRDVKESKFDLRQARDIANEFLDQHEYKDMSAVSYDQYQNIANIIFAKREKDVTIYPQQISVKVALDTLEVIGLQATDYIYGQVQRNIGQPKITAAEARKQLSPNMKVTGESLAIIKNDLDEEVLCHEFIGKMNNNLYRVYINADLGMEEKIETIRPDQAQAAANKTT